MHVEKYEGIVHVKDDVDALCYLDTLWLKYMQEKTFELLNWANMKEEENLCFATVLARYDSSNDWGMGSCNTNGGCEICETK